MTRPISKLVHVLCWSWLACTIAFAAAAGYSYHAPVQWIVTPGDLYGVKLDAGAFQTLHGIKTVPANFPFQATQTKRIPWDTVDPLEAQYGSNWVKPSKWRATLPTWPPFKMQGNLRLGRSLSVKQPDGTVAALEIAYGVAFHAASAWLILGVMLIPLALAHRFAFGRRVRPGRCAGCGYDLRASPDRCPECGRPAPSTTSPIATPV